VSLTYRMEYLIIVMKTTKNASLSRLTIATLLVASNIAVITTLTISSSIMVLQSANASVISSTSRNFGGGVDDIRRNVPGLGAPMATSGDNNVYVTWWSNKSGDWEVFFKASTDSGKTFGPKIDLSNSKGIVSNNAEIAASGSNVYVSWWERANQTSNEPVMRISHDNGKSFGDRIMLSNNATATIAKPLL
jgi:hypothetical protein